MYHDKFSLFTCRTEPYIRDPANPFMNVIYHTDTEREFNRIETQAAQLRAFIRRL